MTAGEDRSGQPPAAVRRDWLEQELGDEWVAQGDGTYRFVGASRDAPIARDDAHRSGEGLARQDPGDEPISREPRQPRFPWRRR